MVFSEGQVKLRNEANDMMFKAQELMMSYRFEAAFSKLEMRRKLFEAAVHEKRITAARWNALKESLGDEEARVALLFGQIFERTGKVDKARIYYLQALKVQQAECRRYSGDKESSQFIEASLKKVACLYIIIRHCMLNKDFASSSKLHAAIDSVEATKNQAKNKQTWIALEKAISQDSAYSQRQNLNFFDGALRERIMKQSSMSVS